MRLGGGCCLLACMDYGRLQRRFVLGCPERGLRCFVLRFHPFNVRAVGRPDRSSVLSAAGQSACPQYARTDRCVVRGRRCFCRSFPFVEHTAAFRGEHGADRPDDCRHCAALRRMDGEPGHQRRCPGHVHSACGVGDGVRDHLACAHSSGRVVSIVSLGLLVPASAVLLIAGDIEEDEFDPSLSLPRSFWRLVAFLAILFFALCSVRGYYPNATDVGSFAVSRTIVGLILIAIGIVGMMAIVLVPRKTSYGSLFYGMLIVATLSVVLVPVLGFSSLGAGVLGSISFGVSMITGWAWLSRVAYRSGAPVVRVWLRFRLQLPDRDSGFRAGRKAVRGRK